MTTIKQLRTTAKLTQKEAANILGVPLQTLINWDRGRRRTPKLILKHFHQAVWFYRTVQKADYQPHYLTPTRNKNIMGTGA